MISSLRAALGRTASRLKQAIIGGGVGSRPVPVPVPVPSCAAQPPRAPFTSSPLHPRNHILGNGIHFYRTWFDGDPEGDVEKQLFELKTRLVLLGAYKPSTDEIQPTNSAEQIMNHPRLDLKSLPLLKDHDVSECIKKYLYAVRALEKTDCYFQLLISLVIGDYIELSTSPEDLTEILRTDLFPELDRSNWAHAVARYVKLCDTYCPSKSEFSKNELLKKLEQERYADMCYVYKSELGRSLFKTSS